MVFQCTLLTKYMYDISQIYLESSVSYQKKIRFIAKKMGNPTLTCCVRRIVYRSVHVPTSGKGKYMQDTILCSPRDIRCLKQRIKGARDGNVDIDAWLRMMIIIIRSVNR